MWTKEARIQHVPRKERPVVAAGRHHRGQAVERRQARLKFGVAAPHGGTERPVTRQILH